MKKVLFVVLCFVSASCFAAGGDASRLAAEHKHQTAKACEIEVSNNTNYPAQSDVAYDDGFFERVTVPAHTSVFINMYYGGYCHYSAHFAVYSYLNHLIYNGDINIYQRLDINGYQSGPAASINNIQ